MKKTFLCILALIIILPLTLSCSESLGSISGVVAWTTLGAGDKVVVGTTVKVWDEEDNMVAYGVTDTTGRYSISNIPYGSYTVTSYQAAASTGTTIAEKSWLFRDVKVESEKTTQLDLNFDNALFDALPVRYR